MKKYIKPNTEIIEAQLSAQYLLTAENSTGAGSTYAPERKGGGSRNDDWEKDDW